MANFFLSIVTVTLLVAGAQAQESAPPSETPSVADAARAAREGQKTVPPKHVITNDDIGAKREAADLADTGAIEQEVRAEVENNYPPNLAKADLVREITKMQYFATTGNADILKSFERSALAGYEGVEFPGKKEWKENLSAVANHVVEEAGKGAARLQAIVDQNQNVLAGHDPAASAQMRETCIAAALPYVTWQQRGRNLVADGTARARAYAMGNQAGAAQYHHEGVRRKEIGVAGMLSEMHIIEDELRNVQGHYACDATQWPRDPQHPEIPNAMWTIYMNGAKGAGYQLDIQGCDSRHYLAVAVPPVSDGSEGRAFCMDESAVVRVAPDGNPATCMSRGSQWNGR